MENTVLNMTLKLRRAAFASDCKLAAGEPGFHTETGELKIGDGTHTWGELGFANQAQIEELINVVDAKVAALGDTYATDKELEDGLALKADLETYNTYVAARQLTDAQINAEFDKYTTTEAQTAIDAEQDRRLGVIEGDYVKAADIANFETKENVKKVADDLSAYSTSNDAAVDLKADKSVVDAMYTNSQIDNLIADAKKYADDNDADTKYGIAYDSDTKKITLVEGGTNFEIDATDFIKDGMIEAVTIGDDNDLVITFNTDAGKQDIKLPLDQLVDIYTGAEGARVTVTVASDKSISADLVAGSITKNYLDSGVQAYLDLADTALQAADLTDYAKTADVVTNDEFTAFEETNAAAINAKLDKATFDTFNDGVAKSVSAIEADIVAKANKALDDAKAYADGKEHKNTTYVAAATENILEFTLTPSEGEAQTVKLVAPTVDVGVEKVSAGTDIVVTPAEGKGEVTVSHKDYSTGTLTKNPDNLTKTGDAYFFNTLELSNGHVTAGSMKSLAETLAGMTFVLDGGTSATTV